MSSSSETTSTENATTATPTESSSTTSTVASSTTTTTTEPPPPTTTTEESEGEDDRPPEFNRTDFLTGRFCTCDLTLASCDVGCCCDEDCDFEDRQGRRVNRQSRTMPASFPDSILLGQLTF